MMLAMRVITNRRLLEFAARHADAGEPLQVWRKVMEAGSYENFAGLRQAFRGVDKVGDLYVFNIAGNKYRLVAYLHFGRQLCYIKHVLTHVEYDKEGWKK
jgi:mRNA interferase HigB